MEYKYYDLFDTSDCVTNVLTDTEPSEVYPEVIRPEDYSDLYKRNKNTLCRIGQNRVKRLLAEKQKEGDEIAGLYRAVRTILCTWVTGDMVSDTIVGERREFSGGVHTIQSAASRHSSNYRI